MSERASSLSAALAQEWKESLLKQAKIVRDWEDGPERAEQAKALIRQALVEWATGKISQETESMLYTILDFAMPEPHAIESEDCAVAYQQQLDRQHCPECGDGRCPTGD